jgi:hypothetical protein
MGRADLQGKVAVRMPHDERVERNFIIQQGLPAPPPGSCQLLTAALLFQPRVVALLLLAAVFTQSSPGFLALACVLWWSAAFPSLSPFDALYRLYARRKPDAAPLPGAEPPRRFAQALAGTFAAVISLALSQEWRVLAYGAQLFFMLAVAALAYGRLCVGSFFYFVLRGQLRFALRTLPWGGGV